ncbi:unnamed protein product [Effrenium voratum]|uniref:Anaphase-promoting complex subunit 4 n=1 Tax=Effrenium voratum TaxID=2562239 RepID=A0AA36JH83_9DINO|nr:unnamed protein product [Effrenium voratum]
MEAFRIFSDRSASDLEAFEWNSTMDLLACLTAPPDSTMSIYRLLSEDQSPKLLSEKVTGVGTTLAWSPCGRRLVVGDRLGGITLYVRLQVVISLNEDGETGAVLHTRRSHTAPITAFCWIDAGDLEDTWLARSSMLPPLLSVPSAPSNMYAETPSKEELSPSGFTLLVSLDEAGHLVVAARGTFPLQAQNLFEGQFGKLSEQCRRPMAVQLSPDLRCLAVLLGPGGSGARTPEGPCARTPSPRPSQAWSHPGELGLAVVVLDVRKFAVRRRELAHCSAMSERLCAVASYALQAVETLATVWRSAASTFVNKMRALIDCIQAYSGAGSKAKGTVHSELLYTLCTGNPSDPVHAFLTRQTTPQQLSRIEKSLMQALDYVNLVTTTRLQVAVQHLQSILQDLKACAGRFSSLGLDFGLLDELETQVTGFSALTEQLLLDVSAARRFARTLFQLFLYQAQKLSEGAPEAGTPSSRADGSYAAPSPSEVDDFVAAVRQQSLELEDVTARIGTRPKVSGEDGRESLASKMARLVSDAERLGQRICSAMARHSSPLLCQSLEVVSPWRAVYSELRAAAGADMAAGVPSPRGLGRPMLHMAWQDLPQQKDTLVESLPEELLLLWAGGATEAKLNLARVRFSVGKREAAVQPKLDLATVKANASSTGHFLLCRCYDADRIAALVLQEEPSRSATVCLIDMTDLEFHPFGSEASAILSDMQVSQSAPLPESYLWASAMRVMSQRGVCSIYSWRARRLLTLDMEAVDEMDDAD